MHKVKAFAKINLNLHVNARREDGYHLIDSLVIFSPEYFDEISFEKASEFSLKVTGSFAKKTLQNNNLIEKALDLFANETKNKDIKNFSIILNKNLPIASGIGGGSADCAATINFINNYFNLGFSKEQLAKLSLKLGADLPACIYSQPLIFEGIGEKISILPFTLPKFKIVLKTPNIKVETKYIFDEFKKLGKFTDKKNDLQKLSKVKTLKDFASYLKATENSLQAITTNHFKEVSKVLKEFKDDKTCLFSAMSGSGGTCFGVYKG